MTNHPNRITTYTVLNRHGDVQAEGETLASAAQIVMNYDGNEYEIRAENDGGYRLWVSRHSRNSTAWDGLTSSRIFSLNNDEALATAEIYRKVIQHADWWNDQRVVTDADYAAELAEVAAQDQE